MKRLNWILILALTLTIPAEIYSAGWRTPPGRQEIELPYSKDMVWSATLEILRGLPLEVADLKSGKIKTEWLIREEIKQHFLFLSSAAETRSRYFIHIMGDTNKSVVSIWTRHEKRKIAGYQSLRYSYFPSDGKREKEFLRKLTAQLKNR